MKFLFGILMWEEIFHDKIPYVFQTPFQFGPLDFSEPEFYRSRKELIEEKLTMLAKMDGIKLKTHFED
jgi:hypothetical protein